MSCIPWHVSATILLPLSQMLRWRNWQSQGKRAPYRVWKRNIHEPPDEKQNQNAKSAISVPCKRKKAQSIVTETYKYHCCCKCNDCLPWLEGGHHTLPRLWTRTRGHINFLTPETRSWRNQTLDGAVILLLLAERQHKNLYKSQQRHVILLRKAAELQAKHVKQCKI